MGAMPFSTSKLEIFQHQDVINIIAKATLGAGPRLVHEMTNIHSECCNIVYLSQPGDSHAIVLSIQTNASTSSMKRSMKLCLQIYEQYNVSPLFVLLCIGVIAPSLKISLLSPVPLKPHWLELKNTLWAEKCLVVSREQNLHSTAVPLDPLETLIWYLSGSKEEKEKLQTVDSTMKILMEIDSKLNRLFVCGSSAC